MTSLVGTWLQGIGLEYAIPSFEAAGIVTPQALASLDVAHFAALGVKEAHDRRKLFYLVQRIKLATEEVEPVSNTAEDEVEAVLSGTLSGFPSARGDSVPIKPDQENSRSPQTTPKNGVATTLSPRGLANSPKHSPKPLTTPKNMDSSKFSPRVRQESSKTDPKLPSPKRTVKPNPRVLRPRKARQTVFPSSDDEDSGEDSGDEAWSAESADDEMPKRRRSSSLKKPTSGRLSTDSDSSVTRRHSGVPRPKSRSTTGRASVAGPIVSRRVPASKRTGKPLSSIPSDSIAPMSPLVPFAKKPEEPPMPTAAVSQDSESDSEPNNAPPRRTKLTRPSSRVSEVGSTSNDSRRSIPNRRHTSIGPSSSFEEGESSEVRVHGRRADDSFKAQIATLREETQSDHDLFDRPAEATLEDEEVRIRVLVRKRPMSSAEIAAAGDVDVIHPLDYGTHGRILVYQPKTKVDLTKSIETVPFAFDNVYDESATNLNIYERSIRHLIPCLFEGKWVSIFAYGQTGSGKTYTMMGSNLTGINNGSATSDPSNLGLYYMAALDLFEAIRTPGFEEFAISVSMFEIYSGKLFDLLNDRSQIKCLEDSNGKVCFPGLSEHGLSSPDQLISLIEAGATFRSTGTTSRNADSSRSHAVLQLYLRRRGSSKKDAEFSRLTFIDLAGSERGADTASSSRATRMEGAEINTSLLALKEVIRALATGDSMTHVPFRGSKLTQVLKESFVGKNCRSVMVACISPNIGNCETTLNTLRYADRVKERNPSTGEVSTAVSQAAKSKKARETSAKTKTSNGARHRAPIQTATSSISLASENSGLLDDLLGSPNSDDIDLVLDDKTPTPVARGKSTLSSVVRSHKSAMTTMLAMVKDEMTMVNKVDADREGLDDYVAELAELQEKQLRMIASLRTEIDTYQSWKAGERGQDSDDDSFLDLRDTSHVE